MHKSVFYTFLIFLNFSMFANTIRGVVTDANKKPVEFSNIILHKYDAPAYVNGTTTDSLGAFEIQNIEDGNYFAEMIFVGYKTDTIPNIALQENSTKDLGTLIMQTEEHLLKGVEITGNKPIIERRADRIIFNAENSTAGTGENLLDLLRSVPSVTVSGNDEIRINGKNQVQIMINGKQETISGDQLVTLLKSIQSNNIKKIEVISNPSARFDATAKGGILDIQLKSNLRSGVNGGVYSSYKQNRQASTNDGFNMNFNYKKIIISTTYNFGIENHTNTKNFIRNFPKDTFVQQFRENTVDKNRFVYHYANVGVKYNINEKNMIGIGGEFFTFRNPRNPLSSLEIANLSTNVIDSSQSTSIKSLTKMLNPSVNLNYKGNLDTAGSTIEVTYDYSYFKLNTNTHLNTAYLDVHKIEYGDRLDFTQDNPFIVSLHTAKLDYYKPLKHKHSIDFGGKFSQQPTMIFTLIICTATSM